MFIFLDFCKVKLLHLRKGLWHLFCNGECVKKLTEQNKEKYLLYRYHLFKARIPLMNNALDAYATRQRTISKNIANATSPHYRPEKVRFEEKFHEAIMVAKGSRSDEMHIPLGKQNAENVAGEVENAPVPKHEVYFSGETHVNIDKEMSELAENQIRFRFVSTQMRGYFEAMLSSVRGVSIR